MSSPGRCLTGEGMTNPCAGREFGEEGWTPEMVEKSASLAYVTDWLQWARQAGRRKEWKWPQ